MDTKRLLADVERREARTAENSNRRWQPDTVASNINLSFNSIQGASYFDDTSKRQSTSETSFDQSFNSLNNFSDRGSTAANMNNLDPTSGIPRINNTSSNEPDVDYAMSTRGGDKFDDLEPDYDITQRPGREIPTTQESSDPVRNKTPGAFKMFPDAASDDRLQLKSILQKRRPEREKTEMLELKSYTESTPPTELRDLSKLPVLREETINACLKSRYEQDLIYTCCGDILISVNPFKDLGLYTQEKMTSYNYQSISSEPHLYMISAKTYQDLKHKGRDQVILVSGESGAGKTEATKLLVRHLIHLAGSEGDSLQETIIQVNPLLENFGNAATNLNHNSSRFAKLLKLKFNDKGAVQSAKIQDFMLEKSRVVHYEKGETTFHSFYCLLAGFPSLQSLYIEPGQTFRITGDFSTSTSRRTESYRQKYKQQQEVFKLIKMEDEEVEDVNMILAAILHLGDVEFEDATKDDDKDCVADDCVVIKDERKVEIVARLLDLDREKLTQALLERKGKIGKGDVIQFSKKKTQADDERDAMAKALYEKLFGWLVRKVNDALTPIYLRNSGSIGILDICGFEDLAKNSFEQLCINVVNEHLQNFMNKKIISDERAMYKAEGITLEEIGPTGVNNDTVLEMFMKKYGILSSIDEDSKQEVTADDYKMVQKLNAGFKQTYQDLYKPSVSNRPEFTITHFAGKVKYDGRSFIKKNRDTLSELVEDCLKTSGSLLVKDLFHVEPSFTGSISMSQYNFQGSRRGGPNNYRPLKGGQFSRSINKSTRDNLLSRFGAKVPRMSSDFSNRKTHIHYFKNSLQELKRQMDNANPHFVRCIKPSDSQKPSRYDDSRVLDQLRYNGIDEVARIRSCGLPVRMAKSDFVSRYGDLLGDDVTRDHVRLILKSVNAQQDAYKIGNSHVFLTNQVQSFLEEDLTELRRKEEEERLRREEEERRRREEEERKRQEEEEREKREREKKRDSLKLKEELNLPTIVMSKSVKFNDLEDIEEAPTPASGASEDSVYNRPGNPDGSLDSRLDPDATSRKTVDNEQDDLDSTGTHSEWIDHFQDIPEEEVHEDINNLRTLKVIKVIIYIFLALLLLISLVVQKVSFIILAMELQTNQPMPQKKLEDRQTVAYFMLILAICIPYGVGFILSVAKLMFGISKAPSFWTWMWVLSIECLQSLGACLLVFRVMRHLDLFKAVYILSATVAIPALVKVVTSDRKEVPSTGAVASKTSWKITQSVGFVFDLLALGVQGSGIYFLIWLDLYPDPDRYEILELVGALVLVNANQWENFADGTCFGFKLNDQSWFKNKVLHIRYELQECRHYPNMLVCLIKIGLTVLLAYVLRDGISLDYETAFDQLERFATSAKSVSAIIALTISAFVAFITSLLALKLQMQQFSFALPLCLATPATLAIFYLDCHYHFLKAVSDAYQSGDDLDCLDRLIWGEWYHGAIFGGVWLLSLLVVCRHVWKDQMDKNTNMNRLFLNPFYCGIMTTEQIMLNQRRHQCKVNVNYKFEENEVDIKSVWYKIDRLATFDSANEPQDHGIEVNDDDIEGEAGPPNGAGQDNNADAANNDIRNNTAHVIPKVYSCATMWHETRTEMVMLLKSLHRLDLDQYLRKNLQQPDVYDPNYYEFEAHIFFDDAMELEDDGSRVPNRWVKDLVGAMGEACSSVHCKPMKVHDPIKMATPYGGQLIWRMPGENLLFVHLKDMSKIRNRKRWSQVMYMYYLLDYRLKMFSKNEALQKMGRINEGRDNIGLNIDEMNMLLGEEHTAMSNKTFILALDGDTDFNPSAIHILLQRMDEENIGATCGRIHPIGSGPMVMYQKFEYAIGHWLQKAAEHVFGCVLCSPGCFSLFRARALMDTNVIKRYTTEPTEPGHHLQYDQGEDRWLCTLLLQRGYRIEYAAGADAWTFAPEGFFEFFNQRRRWMPSTIANILDLLGSAAKTREVNANISLPYIIYTWLLMLMTLMGPGTILMMIAGAFQLIFQIELVTAYLWAVIPIIFYTVGCFWLKSQWQLILAAVLSIGYAFVMMIVIVGTIITASTENIFHPSVIIMAGLLAIFIITGLCHPKEWTCLLHGFLYILAVPSGYLILVIYSICNLNDVSWGTREVPTKAQRLEMERKKKEKELEKLNKPKRSFFRRLFDSGEGQIKELTNLIRTIVPNKDGNAKDPASAKSTQDNNLQEILERLDRIEKNNPPQSSPQQPSSPVLNQPQAQPSATSTTTPSTSQQPSQQQTIPEQTQPSPPAVVEDEVHPAWTKTLGKGTIIKANKDEIRFWRGLVDTYLLPIKPTPEEKKKIADGLRELRNSAAFAFIMVNTLWMALNFMFQYTEAAKVQLSYKLGDSNYDVEESVLGMSFVFVLLILLLLQFVGMVIHRMGTLQQLLATTKIWGKYDDTRLSQISQMDETIRYLKMVLQMPAFNDEGTETEPPEVAEENNPIGLSIKPSGRSLSPLNEDLSQSVRSMGTIIEASRRPQSFMDRKSSKTLTEVRKRLEGTNILDRQGRSYRPNLPPRNNSSRRWNRNPHHVQSEWGFTPKELRARYQGRGVIPEITPSNRLVDPRQMAGMGALGRSLHMRSTVIQQVQNRQNRQDVQWDANDLRLPGQHRYPNPQRYLNPQRYHGARNHV